MIAGNFIDEVVPDWQMKADDAHRVTVQSTIVYRLPGTQRQFEKAVSSLDARQQTFAKAVDKISERRGIFRVIDSNSTSAARTTLSKKHGESFLDKFIYDTEKAIIPEIGNAFRRVHEKGVKTYPKHVSDAVSILPARSFTNHFDLSRFDEKRGNTWVPTVRLTLCVTLEGHRDQVEAAIHELKAGMLFCGPLTTFTEAAAVPQEYDEPEVRLPLAAV
jgi:hypothetical protein